jgi:hypothetical protein
LPLPYISSCPSELGLFTNRLGPKKDATLALLVIGPVRIVPVQRLDAMAALFQTAAVAVAHVFRHSWS